MSTFTLESSAMLTISRNIFKGLIKKATAKQGRYKKISWLKKKLLKHEEDQSLKVLSISGLHIQYKRPYELLHSYEDIFNHEIYRFKSDTDQPVILDCGSNIGLAALYFKSQYPMSQLHCFEPDPNNFRMLEDNLKLNTCDRYNLHQKAIWKDNHGITFIAMGSEGSRISEEVTEKTVTMETVSLGDLLNDFTQIDLLKLDIEGAEKTVLLESGLNLSHVKNLFIEYHGKAEETATLRKILQLVEKTGYKTYIKMAADHLSSPFYQKSTNSSWEVQLNIFCYK